MLTHWQFTPWTIIILRREIHNVNGQILKTKWVHMRTKAPWNMLYTWNGRNAARNTPWSAEVFMRQWIRSSLIQLMACRLLGARPLPKPMMTYYQLDVSITCGLPSQRTSYANPSCTTELMRNTSASAEISAWCSPRITIRDRPRHEICDTNQYKHSRQQAYKRSLVFTDWDEYCA